MPTEQKKVHIFCFCLYKILLILAAEFIKAVRHTDVVHFTIEGFKLGTYFLKMALSCRNMSECSGSNVTHTHTRACIYIFCNCIYLVY